MMDATLPAFFTIGPVTLDLWRAAKVVDRKAIREKDDSFESADDAEAYLDLPSLPQRKSTQLATRGSASKSKQKHPTKKTTETRAHASGKATKITKNQAPKQTSARRKKTMRKYRVPLPGELIVAPSIAKIVSEVC
jgi:hypothetical protein